MPVLRRPASSNSRQTTRRSSGQALRRPAAAGQSERRSPAAAGQSERRRQQNASAAGGSQQTAPISDQDMLNLFNFDFWVTQVARGQFPLESAPTFRLALKGARHLGRKLKCSICREHYEKRDLAFQQWAPRVWTAYCRSCRS